LSRRARFDIATLVAAGVASSLFFLLPLWTSHRSTAPVPSAPPLAAAEPAVVDAQPSAVAPKRRAAPRITRSSMPEPAIVQVKAEPHPQSRISRLLLGDGTEPIQPFPLAARRAER